eukprot:6444-Heterococcus_DN1.PRE.1
MPCPIDELHAAMKAVTLISPAPNAVVAEAIGGSGPMQMTDQKKLELSGSLKPEPLLVPNPSRF